MQDTAANCGPASLSNALAALGLTHSQQECATLCKTTATDGTSEKQLIAALKGLGRTPLVLKERKGETATLWLDHYLREGRPALLIVDNQSHWVSAIGLLNDRILIADPADNDLVLTYSRAGLMARWGTAPTGSVRGHYYGIVL